MRSTIELIKTGRSDISYETCHEFICHLIEKNPKKIRGPYLARLELHRLMREESADAIGLLGDYSQLLLEYFRNFGDRNCCPHDMRVFCPYLTKEQYEHFLEKLLAMAPLEEDGTSTTEAMMKYICAMQVCRIWDTTEHRSKEVLEALSTKLINLYNQYQKRFESKLLTTDISPCDQFVVLAGEWNCLSGIVGIREERVNWDAGNNFKLNCCWGIFAPSSFWRKSFGQAIVSGEWYRTNSAVAGLHKNVFVSGIEVVSLDHEQILLDCANCWLHSVRRDIPRWNLSLLLLLLGTQLHLTFCRPSTSVGLVGGDELLSFELLVNGTKKLSPEDEQMK